MKRTKFFAFAMSGLMVFASCNMNNTAKGGLIGGGSGAAVGAVIGQLIGHNTGGTLIGAGVGAAVGTAAGVLIGKKMDKVKAQAQAVENAQVQTMTDKNGLECVKVTFDSGILFATGKSDLTASAKSALQTFANKVLKPNQTLEVSIQGYTDNTGFKGKTAEQSAQLNVELSQKRADAVKNYLQSLGVSVTQIASSVGYGQANPVADNSTAYGQQQNRRVEAYLYASQQMINDANNGTLQ